MPGVQHARSLACKIKSIRVSHHGHIGFTRHSPRNGFNKLPRALPGDQDFLTPSLDGQESAKLTPTSRRQDHTSWPSVSTPFVKGAFTSIASRSAYRDDREPPLMRNGTAYL